MDEPVRNDKGRFVKGSSGNPGGYWRDRKLRKVRRMLEELDPDAMEALKKLMKDGDPKVIAKAVEIWARYRLPIPKEGKEDAAAKTPGQATLPDHVRAALARLQ